MSFMDLPAKAVVERELNNPASASQVALSATYVPRWKATTTYALGDKVVSPDGDTVTAKAAFTSGASYSAANWDLSPTYMPRNRSTVYNVLDYGTNVGTGGDDTPAFNAAATAAWAAGGGTVYAPAPPIGYYQVKSQSGTPSRAIIGKPKVNFYGENVRLRLIDSSDMIALFGTPGSPYTITANTVVTDDTITVGSTTGLAVGDTVLVRAGQAAYDAVEPVHWIFAKIVTLTSTTVKIDQPIGYALDVTATTNTENKSIRKITDMIENVTIEGFDLYSPLGAISAAGGIGISYCRNITVNNISGEHVGPGLVKAQYTENIVVNNPVLRACQKQSASKGRAFSFAESRGFIVKALRAANFENVLFFIEASSSGVIDSPVVVNNSTIRDNSQPLFYVTSLSTVTIRNLDLSGKGSTLASNAFSGRVVIAEPRIHTGTRTDLNLGLLTAPEIDGVAYPAARIVTKTVLPTVNALAQMFPLPSGLIKSARVYASSLTGITALLFKSTTGGTDYKASLVAGTMTPIPVTISAIGVPASYPINADNTKNLQINTDATFVAGTRVVVEVEYYPFGTDPAGAW